MKPMPRFQLQQIGTVRSSLKSRRDCPSQEREGAPEAWIEIDPAFAEGLLGLHPGKEILVFTWLHLGNRNTLQVHPRGNRQNPLKGVFATRSPSRPNPVGFHQTRIVSLEQPLKIKVDALEVVDKTPVIDIKPVI
ncbi:MAG: tRNA (N6-threonylcarbamoyladenosine(37)-N6)-methyltransferase TrmO [Desulfobacteraceae bacterium 4572_87]|nr:MAG: tRNA (N6-threonylcarbamoyladenosine(37)-N6)-methyltransferase TrmO [Desulfobacteraceae bacterium 4572_87]